MKTFAGNKTFNQIERQCKEAGIQFDSTEYDKGGDYVVIRTRPDDNQSGYVLYNTVNGSFFGTTHEGVRFDSRLTTHEHETWFQMLLSFFYVEKVAA